MQYKIDNELIRHQIIEDNGHPLFVLVPYEEYLFLVDEEAKDDVPIPLAVSKAANMDDKSLVRAWREYKGLSQAEVAKRLGVSRPSYAQMEEKGANLRTTTMHRLSDALEVQWAQRVSHGFMLPLAAIGLTQYDYATPRTL